MNKKLRGSNINDVESIYRRTPKPETDSGSKHSLFRGTPIESVRPHIMGK